MTNFGDQVFEFGGAPVGSGRFSSPWATHYFVDYDDGTPNGSGKRPDTAIKTIQAAVTLASGGDVIYIRPRAYQLGRGFRRYSENVTVTLGGAGGSGAVATNANISLIGVTQRGAGCPSDGVGVRWTFDTSGTPLTNNAPGTHVENIGFFAESATYAIHLESDGGTRTKSSDFTSIYNCMIKGADIFSHTLVDGIQIVGCKFQCDFNGTGTPLINMVGSAGAITRLSIRNCEFVGGNANNYATSPITTAGPIHNVVIRDCYFTADPDSGDYITFSGGSSANTGVVANCYFASEDANAKLQSIVSGVQGVWGAGLCDENGMIDLSS